MNRAVFAEAQFETNGGWARTGMYLYPAGPLRVSRWADGYKRLVWVNKYGEERSQRFRGALYLTSETDAS